MENNMIGESNKAFYDNAVSGGGNTKYFSIKLISVEMGYTSTDSIRVGFRLEDGRVGWFHTDLDRCFSDLEIGDCWIIKSDGFEQTKAFSAPIFRRAGFDRKDIPMMVTEMLFYPEFIQRIK